MPIILDHQLREQTPAQRRRISGHAITTMSWLNCPIGQGRSIGIPTLK